MPSRISFVDKDMGYRKFVRQMRSFDGAALEVGLFADEATDIHPFSGNTVIDYAIMNEFGNEQVPERPFMRLTFDMSIERWMEAIAMLVVRVLTGSMAITNLLLAIGDVMVVTFRESIEDWSAPPNRPFTIRKKGFDNPLVWTGKMKSSITKKVYP